MFNAIIYTGYKPFDFGIEVGTCTANTIGQIKRMASKLCNKYRNTADAFTIMHEGKVIAFYRFNNVYPDGTIVRGEWH